MNTNTTAQRVKEYAKKIGNGTILVEYSENGEADIRKVPDRKVACNTGSKFITVKNGKVADARDLYGLD